MNTGNTVAGVTGGPQAPQAVAPSLRSLRINTNATPGSYAPPADAGAQVVAPAEEENKENVGEAENEATKPLSPQFAALAKQRRALQVKERELAERERALSGKSPTQGDYIDRARIKSEPLSVLLESGVTYDELTQAVLNQQGGYNPEIHELKQKLKALEEGVEQKLTQREEAQREQAISEMRRTATQLAADGDRFEMIRAGGHINDVIKLMVQTYDNVGELLDVEEAMQMVEDQLLEDTISRAKLGKVWNKLAPENQPMVQQRPGMRTLTNRDTAQVPMSPKQRALAAFYGQLKK